MTWRIALNAAESTGASAEIKVDDGLLELVAARFFCCVWLRDFARGATIFTAKHLLGKLDLPVMELKTIH